jgi:probable F420-dependent oxidoreductase
VTGRRPSLAPAQSKSCSSRPQPPSGRQNGVVKIGAVLTLPWLSDLAAARDAVIRLDEAGFDHVSVGGHVLTAEEGRYPERPAATYALTYRDPIGFFSSLAPGTSRIRFRTSILILPMLPTALVAKQAADLAILSNGRFDLGVGVSWQEVEYRALGESLRGRARRLEEQVEVLRLLWAQPFVSFEGEFHQLDALGVGQLPPPIPVWFGCGADELPLRRAGRLADGWLPLPPEPTSESVTRLRAYAEDTGRDAHAIAIAGRIIADEDVIAAAEARIAAGATELNPRDAADPPTQRRPRRDPRSRSATARRTALARRRLPSRASSRTACMRHPPEARRLTQDRALDGRKWCRSTTALDSPRRAPGGTRAHSFRDLAPS